jgi:hypothetical protein
MHTVRRVAAHTSNQLRRPRRILRSTSVLSIGTFAGADAGEGVAPRDRHGPRLPWPVALPRHRRVAGIVARDAAPLPEDDGLGPQHRRAVVVVRRVAAAAALEPPHEHVVVLHSGGLMSRSATHGPDPPEPLGCGPDVLRRQAPPRRDRVRRQENRRDGPVRADVDDRDRSTAARRIGVVGLIGGVGRRRRHLRRRRGTGGGARAATAAVDALHAAGTRRRGAIPAQREGMLAVAGVDSAQREADGEEGGRPRGVDERRRGCHRHAVGGSGMGSCHGTTKKAIRCSVGVSLSATVNSVCVCICMGYVDDRDRGSSCFVRAWAERERE